MINNTCINVNSKISNNDFLNNCNSLISGLSTNGLLFTLINVFDFSNHNLFNLNKNLLVSSVISNPLTVNFSNLISKFNE